MVVNTKDKGSLGVAIGSLGTIGTRVARELVRGIDGLRLVAVSGRDLEKARAGLEAMGSEAMVVAPEALGDHADIVVECAPAAAFGAIAGPAIEKGRILVPATVGALLFAPELIARARETGARIVVPTGAIAGLDAVRAVALGKVESATLKSSKPPRGLAGAPHLAGTGYDPDALKEAVCVFRGNTFEAAKAFPANVNVAAALALAGIGPERTMVEIWADPAAQRNTHTISVIGDAARLEITIEAVPSPENPKSSTLTPLSIVAALRSLVEPVRIGS